MPIWLDEQSLTPIYQQIVNYFSRDIQDGTLPVGYKLPPVRDLAQQTGASQGTVKHAYDTLERLGLIEKAQGRGSFVCATRAPATGSTKAQALFAIDNLIDEMQELGFSTADIRIFFDLKMREREQMGRTVSVAVVDCTPEALSAVRRQIGGLEHADVVTYDIEAVLAAPPPGWDEADILVTTPIHIEPLRSRIPQGQATAIVVVDMATETLIEIARIPGDATVGVLCKSERYAGFIRRSLRQYRPAAEAPRVALFGQTGQVEAVAERANFILVPHHYQQFCSRDEQVLIRTLMADGRVIICYYQIERGSLLHLREQIEALYLARKNEE